MAWDYTCRNTLADSYKEHTAVEVGYAAKQGEKDKYVNYEDAENFDKKGEIEINKRNIVWF